MKTRAGLAAAAAALALVTLPGAASATVTHFYDGFEELSVESDGSDSITVNCSGGNAQVNGVVLSPDVPCDEVQTIRVEGGPAANTINLSGIAFNEFPEIEDSLVPIRVDGNGGADTIDGSQTEDRIRGNDGADDIEGRAGPDQLIGGDGADDLDGELDADELEGEAGADTLATDDTGGPDSMTGGADSDELVIFGDLCVNVVVGPTSIHTDTGDVAFEGIERAVFTGDASQGSSFDLTNAPFRSIVNGTTHDDTAWTSPFNDQLLLGAHDTLTGDTAGAKIDAPEIFVSAGGLSGDGVGNDSWSGVERLTLVSPTVPGTSTTPVDSLWDASLWPGPANIQAGSGNDTLIGGPGNDGFGQAPDGALETGDDVIVPGGGDNSARGGPGFDTVRDASVSNATANAAPSFVSLDAHGAILVGIEQVSLTGTGGDDVLDMSNLAGRAVIDGSGGADDLRGSEQDDRITGGPGSEINLDGNGGVDTIAETLAAPGSAAVADGSLTGFPGTETFADFERVHLIGTVGDDGFTAAGFTGAVTFEGLAGNDGLTGGLGADGLFGGAGTDTLLAREGAVDQAVDCGADADSAETDANDPTPVDCETVNGAPFVPPGSGGPAPGPGAEVDTLAPAVTVRAGRVNRRGRVRLRFTCPANEITCNGSFRLRAKNGKKTITVGRGKFSAAGGKTKAVSVKLTKAGRKLLRKRRRLPVRVALTAVDAAGNSAVIRPRLTLRRARKPTAGGAAQEALATPA